ncbi:lipid-binding SYLF domain-containing protein [Desulfobacterales bacterium HSG17]|nr:lipid-binding SYLF domain-containing protein [Desulfobacterales bacterium HSG17]
MKKSFTIIIFIIFLLTLTACSGTTNVKSESAKTPQQEIVDSSAIAVRIMRSNPDNRSLNYLLKHAKGVLIFPKNIKAGFLLAGEAGQGIMAAKDEDGNWSSPAFYNMTGGSVGLQVGLQRSSVILVFMNDRVFNSAIDSGLTLGVDATVAAGSSSFNMTASTKTIYSDIYYFATVEGLFAGIAMDGCVISINNGDNQAYYNSKAEPREILLDRELDNSEANVLKIALMTLSK